MIETMTKLVQTLAEAPAWLFPGRVMHRRHTAPAYRFEYSHWSLLVNLDHLPALPEATGLVQYNRPGLVGFHDCDHGPRDGSALRPWFDRLLAEQGLDREGGPAWLLMQPRVLGVGFNPLSLWFGWHRDGRLLAVLAEVRNTFGDWHGYLLHRQGAALGQPVRSRATKCFHVSPFLPLSGEYAFRIRLDGTGLGVGIRYAQDGVDTLTAVQTATRQRLTSGALLRALARPLPGSTGTLAAIHWQALKIWLRGGRYHPRPAPPKRRVTPADPAPPGERQGRAELRLDRAAQAGPAQAQTVADHEDAGQAHGRSGHHG